MGDKPDHRLADGRFSAARFTNQAERFPFPDIKRNPVHGFHLGYFPPEDPSINRKIFDKVNNFDQMVTGGHRICQLRNSWSIFT